ncbi:uncharacterized protein OCT59_004600 [Rhizophagus irregularis]|uniref:uncharacterized protein n=1 Tax=Rhizophagus irregularis TaxID=588596 RepID=UPI0019DEE62E|nr:hypothetical protein OCT59_004600 [Rhizophagus irregularis]GET51351.1 hypothetical protein RIR_jg40640.t1 [Rhizophagus irregularis DAOM 181602=DAOM 197198]
MKLNLLLAILLLLVAISQAAPIRTIEKRDEDCGSIGDIGKRHEGQSCRGGYMPSGIFNIYSVESRVEVQTGYYSKGK